MINRKNILATFVLVVLMAFVVVVPNSFAALPTVTESFNADAAQEINQALHSNTVTDLGTRLRGILTAGSQTNAESTYAGDNTTAETITESQVNITTGANYGSSTGLANGQANQVITFTLATDGGLDHKISPITKTGFTDITLDDAGDSVTMKYVNSTIGWTIIGGNGYNIDSDFGSTSITATGVHATDNVLAGESVTTSTAIVTTGSAGLGSSTTLNDGYINQTLTFVLETDGGADHQISPKTKTGFASISMTDANDSITLRYISDVIGWTLVGNAGATIN